jgi:hypothetical protein
MCGRRPPRKIAADPRPLRDRASSQATRERDPVQEVALSYIRDQRYEIHTPPRRSQPRRGGDRRSGPRTPYSGAGWYSDNRDMPTLRSCGIRSEMLMIPVRPRKVWLPRSVGRFVTSGFGIGCHDSRKSMTSSCAPQSNYSHDWPTVAFNDSCFRCAAYKHAIG